jgi:hypothetical protein
MLSIFDVVSFCVLDGSDVELSLLVLPDVVLLLLQAINRYAAKMNAPALICDFMLIGFVIAKMFLVE